MAPISKFYDNNFMLIRIIIVVIRIIIFDKTNREFLFFTSTL